MSRFYIENLRYRYPASERDILKGVCLEIPKSKVTALLGPNGSGKSTLFKVLLKVLRPYEGSIYVDGENLEDVTLSSLSKMIAWVPQEEDSLFPYTVLDYIIMGRTPHLGFFSMPNDKDEETAENVLTQLGLPNIAHRKVPTLSGGEKKLVSIARALVQQCETLLLDEPTAHLDIGNKARVLNIVKKMANSGKTIIFSTHDPNEAFLAADNVVMINSGEVVSTGPPAAAITEGLLEKIYGVHVTMQKINGKQIVVGLNPESFKPS
ncbi:MAG: ABC transporter ATP-binding protein [Candidatus Bathyarchaeia archaeon]